MKTSVKAISGLGFLIFTFVLAAFFIRTSDSHTASTADAANRRSTDSPYLLDTAADRIRAESSDLQSTPIAISPAKLRASDQRIISDASQALPPPGYSFATHHGQMTKAILKETERDETDDETSVPNWINSSSAIDAIVDQAVGANRDWTFGWILIADGIQADELQNDVRLLGGEVLGSLGRLVRAKLPGDDARLATLLSLRGVVGVGAVPSHVKLPHAFEPSAVHATHAVFVTLMTDDPDERWRHKLESMGAVVGRFDADTRSYAANLSSRVLNEIIHEDFVLAVEPVRTVKGAHDTAVPAIGADALRRYRSPGLFADGGASVPVGVMDSGLNINHLDISSHRDSICGANFVTANRRTEDLDLWVDQNGHGTHVTGTILGNGFGDAMLAGVAPSVRNIRFAKALDQVGTGDTLSIVRAMDFLATQSNCRSGNAIGNAIRPLIVNASLALAGRAFTGREVDQRKLDAVVWRHSQLYVVVQGNEGTFGSSNTSSAKNALAVGAIRDGGALAIFSSRGPTADGRLAPQLVAPGVSIRSPAGNGSRGEYQTASGTSSAAPAVAGIAALLMDRVSAFQNQPALTRARLMASAISPAPWLEGDERFPMNNTAGPGDLQAQYGLGKASARTSVLDGNGSDGWTNGSATSELKNGEYAFQDIVVPEGASRLQLVLTWDEPPSDAISATVLNDLDLWLDRFGDCGLAACGEYSSRSRIDNVEWIFVNNPRAGTYRAKVVPRRIYAAAPRSALAWTVIRGSSTPTLHVELDEDHVSERRSKVKLLLTSDAYVAAGTRLRVDCRMADGSGCNGIRLHNVQVSREDETPGKAFEWGLGTHLSLGEIDSVERQVVEFLVDLDPKIDDEDAMRLYFTASGWNANASVATLTAGATHIDVPLAPTPKNDNFAQAITLGGSEGSIALDLMSASTEAGEPTLTLPERGGDAPMVSGSVHPTDPLFEPPQGRPAASVWYDWNTPNDGHFRFVTGSRTGDVEPIYVDVYIGDDIVDLRRVYTNVARNSDFFAQRGRTYRIRVSNGTRRDIDYGRSIPITLRWFEIARPANDNFEFGAVLEGSEGRYEGNNHGATLQSGEWFGGFASTVWHQWTAPQNGAVRFDTSNGSVMVFTGKEVTGLRLVSQIPDDKAIFTVRLGDVYRIAVAVESTLVAGAPYELDWRFVVRHAGNDDFDEAESVGNAMSASHYMDVDVHATVEPAEPQATGVRSKWWVWTAPTTATYTWRMNEASYSPLQIAVFSGSSLQDLVLEGGTRSGVSATEFTFMGVKDQRYWIAAGLPHTDVSAYREENIGAPFTWGPTPPNDDLANMAPLYGMTGSVDGSSAFATIGADEPDRNLGHSSLWWSYQPAADGWYRFYLEDTNLPYVLAVYEMLQDGSLKLLSVSQQNGLQGSNGGPRSTGPGQEMPTSAASVEVIYRANAGGRYVLRVGSLNYGSGGEFTLRWEATVAPVWFKFLGQVAGGETDRSGTYIDPQHLAMLSGMATDAAGTLFVANSSGVLSFEHDSASNSLSVVQALDKDWSSTPRALLYDQRRHRLYAHGCLTWEVFLLSGSRLIEEGRDDVGATVCSDGRAFMDSSSSSVYVVVRSVGLEVFQFNADHRLHHAQSVDIPGTMNALIAESGDHVYVATQEALVSFERDSESGSLTQTSSQALSQNFIGSARNGLAIDPDDAYLFAFTDAPFGNEVVIFDLNANPTEPKALHTLSLDDHLRSLSNSGCLRAETRMGTPGIGLFCDGAIFGIQWNAQTAQLKFTDVVRRIDRFNNAVPFFDFPRTLALSPNGKYAYVATDTSGILYFERIGNSGTTD